MKGFSGWRLAAIFCFRNSYRAEILAYYVPFIDNLLDTVTYSRLQWAQGTLLLTSVLPIDNDFLRWWPDLFLGEELQRGDKRWGTALQGLHQPNWRPVQGTLLCNRWACRCHSGLPVLSLFTPFSYCRIRSSAGNIHIVKSEKEYSEAEAGLYEKFNLWKAGWYGPG